MKKLVSTLAPSILALALAISFSANAMAGQATDVVKANQQKLFTVIAKPKSKAQQDELRKMFDEYLAYDVFAQRSLGDEWGKLDAAQKEKFQDLLTQIIRNNYKRNLKKLLDFDISYQAEESKSDGTLVNSIAKHKTDDREPPFELDFLMKSVDGKMKIIDIIPEDASMTKTYKAQFLRILRKDGFDKLIQKMEDKLAKMDA
ncbi:MAG: ABC transporter substrate-binding protein [Polyangiaceae bacterium]